ncbi:MAG: lysophospholipase [Gammaproteobacteria bacterium]|nr:lysophospholipase [Gammaproteobacteria bacterium]
MNTALIRFLFAGLLLVGLAACVLPRVQHYNDTMQTSILNGSDAIMADGYRLPVSTWSPPGEPQAVILALHGFNDYRNAFREPAAYFAAHGIMTVAYDQRGFGATDQHGVWPAQDRLQQDAVTVAKLLCKQYPQLPLFVLGESMGGAVLIDALNGSRPDCVAGTILVAPAVWGWQTMPWWQALTLRIAAHVLPAMTLTGEGLDIQPSDNIEMLRALARDPLVIKATRIDALYGITNLMTAAFSNSSGLTPPVLLLYGEHDEIIPPAAFCHMSIPGMDPDAPAWQTALYPDGYHMLLRDLQAQVVLRDIVAWVGDQQVTLPSGHDGVSASAGLQRLCTDA